MVSWYLTFDELCPTSLKSRSRRFTAVALWCVTVMEAVNSAQTTCEGLSSSGQDLQRGHKLEQSP